ncbi:MAG TPA: ATP-dependent helicase [Gemmatimonadaceae bacterium]|jgi:DNA helicase-2/ATP-dependent DNA helicase PcrA|nr:ATP-dependent helicase [Gemmatimonadaceae bacterium]
MADVTRLYPARQRLVEAPTREFASELNSEQAMAATHGEGPLLIIAGAGTGKTRTLIYRVAHLIDRGVAPERILLLTFTRRAAHEMLSRAERLVGSASSRVQGGTFHATGHRLLRQFGPEAGLPRDFSIMDQGDAEDLMQLARANLGYGRQEKRFPKKESLHYIYSTHLNADLPVEEILQQEFPHFLEYTRDIVRIFAEYTSRKSERNLVDYDDLLLFWALMLEASPSLADRISGLHDHILVDEYQDTNLLQARILRGTCRTHRNITVVGDDAQSIYSFRGANFRNILDFPEQFAGATIIALEQNYRSTQPILDVTNTLISRALERFTKNLWTERAGGDPPWLVTARDEQQQTRFVVDRILELHEDGMPLREIAVLVRAGYMSADLEIELTNRKIPFEKWGGIKFLEASHVKDVLAFLRVLENPRDEVSWYRILMLMPGIGDVTARAMMESMAERSWDPDAFSHFAPPPRARDAHKNLVNLLRRLRGSRTEDAGIGEDIDEIRALYDSILAERYDRAEPRLADLDQLRVIAAGYPNRSAFLAALALEPPQSTQDLGTGSESDDDALVISTVHSAKGKEWDAVFVIWAVDGWFPSSRSLEDESQLEEERRLMYVAMTRARNHLAVTYPLNVYATRRGSDYSIDQLSRFIDRGLREKMQRVVPQEAGAPAAPVRAPIESPAIDLRALLRGRFGA